MVHKIGGDLKFRILTGRMQGVDASDTPVADYGSIPRDGENPALTPGYALPPGIDTPEGSEPTASFGRGWIAFAHLRHEGSEPISSFRTTLSVPPEPETRSGQTVFLFPAMQDPIPMTLVPALQWGPSAAGGGEYWSVASWYVGGTTGAVFHGELVPVNAGDELTAFFDLVRRQRAHFDYRCGFEGLSEADLPGLPRSRIVTLRRSLGGIRHQAMHGLPGSERNGLPRHRARDRLQAPTTCLESGQYDH